MNENRDYPFELGLLAGAANYQRWAADTVLPFLGNRILEIGSGLGSMSKWLPARELLVLTETDPALLAGLERTVASAFQCGPRVAVQRLDIESFAPAALSAYNFDTVVSFNVLEHLADDKTTLARLVCLLQMSVCLGPKRIVSFVPAHAWAFGLMDASSGHYRRYSMEGFRQLAAAVAPTARFEARYFNLFGLLGWIIIGKLLRSPHINPTPVAAFERICPYVRGCDDFLHKTLHVPLGQSLLTVMTLDDGRRNSASESQ